MADGGSAGEGRIGRSIGPAGAERSPKKHLRCDQQRPE